MPLPPVLCPPGPGNYEAPYYDIGKVVNASACHARVRSLLVTLGFQFLKQLDDYSPSICEGLYRNMGPQNSQKKGFAKFDHEEVVNLHNFKMDANNRDDFF